MNKNDNIYLLKFTIFIIILIILLVIVIYNYHSTILLNNKFYDYNIICPELKKIENFNIIEEVKNNISQKEYWIDWPEINLYESKNIDGSWKIIPFYGFNTWCNRNCKKFPNITKFLKKIKNLKIASLSKIGPKTKLIPHYGYASYSNNILRCHYGLILPKNTNDSYISVQDNKFDKAEIQSHKLYDWIIFDDSKLHYAVNNSNEERIVLIIDIERPINIKKGVSNSSDGKELLELVNEIKKLNNS
jgi:beta-hydroxylase